MLQRTQMLRVVVLLGWLALVAGCGGPSGQAAPQTPAQYFQEHQKATMTPNGKIRTETVEEKDGKIQYQTEDGKHWRVGYTKRTDGTYEYRTPEDVP